MKPHVPHHNPPLENMPLSPCKYLVQELKQIMARYGGFFVNYMNKDVTHIICANLPDSKLKLKERVKER